MNRLQFVCYLALTAVCHPALHASQRPNIVFILSDDHAWQTVSAYGESRRLVETPNIDRIAREGMRFDRCLVTNAICGPARATILTGKYSHLNGFYNNANGSFDGSQQTFPKLLQQAGYSTLLVGKWHLNSNPTGFTDWDIVQGQGTYYNPVMIRNGRVQQQEGYATDVITDHTIEMLERRDKEKPFLMMCHHKSTHRGWDPALRHLEADGKRQYPEPATLFDDYEGRGAAEREQEMSIAEDMQGFDVKLSAPATLNAEQRAVWDAHYAARIEEFRGNKPKGRDLVRWRYQRYIHDYIACVRSLDESVGKLLKYLDDNGLADNTIVVYSSDQGFFLGEHGWFDKRWIFEESLRTPLVVRWPSVVARNSTNDSIVSNLDFAETFLDAAGVAVPADMQGRSLVPLLRGEHPADWRTSFYYHYYEYPEPHRVNPHYGVVTDRYKLVRFYGTGNDYWELFDREADPQEMKSFWGAAEYQTVQAELTKELDRLRQELKVPAVDAEGAFGN
ncbi:sulfatase family protein [Lacipirellula sp.]|uniref:sulfatase family protein n=1 Tax=Lacipirellula sp. TaxID=2691419 RepID=UPI003D131C33